MTPLDASFHKQIRIATHDESADSPRMHNEPGSSTRDGQPINVDAPDHVVVPQDVEMHHWRF